MLIKKLVLIVLLNISIQILLITSTHAHGPIQTGISAIDINTFPPVEDDIQAMAQYSSKASEAGQRLVERGMTALDNIHHALENPVSFQQQMQLLCLRSGQGS